MSTRLRACVFLLLVSSGAALAQPLTTAFTYQGELRSSGTLAEGMHDLRFRLYDAATGGNQVGSTVCSDNVALSEGRFTVVLDFGSQFAGQQRFLEIDARADTGLGCGDATDFVPLTPRQPLTAAPNAVFSLTSGHATTADTAATALSATNATQLNGQSAAFYQNAGNLSAGTIPSARVSGTYSGAIALSNAGNSFTGGGGGLTGLNASNIASGTLADGRLAPTYTQALSLTNASNWFVGAFTGGGAGLTDLNASNISAGTLNAARFPVPLELSGSVPAGAALHVGNSSPTGGATGVTGVSVSDQGRGVYGLAASSLGDIIGVEGRSFYSPTGTGVVGTARATGGWFEATDAGGTGLFGVNTSASGITYGVQGRSTSPSGTAIRGESTATTGAGHGVIGLTHSGGGIGVWGSSDATSGTGSGVYGESSSTTGSGVKGRAYASSGSAIGVHGITSSAGGFGVYGGSTATSGYAVGVKGEVTGGNATGTGVVGYAAATGGYFEATNSTGNGVYGFASSSAGGSWGTGVRGVSASPIGTGVWGVAPSSGWAVFAEGSFGASGTKSFRIDHPADPENKYLLHYCAESPEVINFYSGTIALDSAGGAVVQLPAYFASISKDPRYTLTAVGAPMPMLHIAEEINADALLAGERAKPGEPVPTCSFRIAGGAAGAKVSWEVKAVRNDAYVRQRGAPVETDKIGPERGTYQHPELFGQPPERGVHHQMHEDSARLREAHR